MSDHTIVHMSPRMDDRELQHPHSHGVSVDVQGNGKTTTTTGHTPHVYTILSYRVLGGRCAATHT